MLTCLYEQDKSKQWRLWFLDCVRQAQQCHTVDMSWQALIVLYVYAGQPCAAHVWHITERWVPVCGSRWPQNHDGWHPLVTSMSWVPTRNTRISGQVNAALWGWVVDHIKPAYSSWKLGPSWQAKALVCWWYCVVYADMQRQSFTAFSTSRTKAAVADSASEISKGKPCCEPNFLCTAGVSESCPHYDASPCLQHWPCLIAPPSMPCMSMSKASVWSLASCCIVKLCLDVHSGHFEAVEALRQ